jgi:methylenetetrahydrofolate dehydrogenase (NADP+)/methenyltetrahydrofolate cyclohydrolase
MDKEDFDPSTLLRADVVVSATGMASLIHGYMVKDGIVAIDVGYPRGDFDPGVAKKASFFTPVPGGVGPVTVAMLFANLVDLVERNSRL